MPHKVTTVGLLDEVTPTVKVAGSCNAILRRPDGRLLGDMFDGAGFVRGVAAQGLRLAGSARAGGRLRRRRLGDRGVAGRGGRGRHRPLRCPRRIRGSAGGPAAQHYPALEVTTGSNDPAGFDLVVNATPMGMNDGDPMPMDVTRIAPSTFVGEVVMKQEMTAFLRAAQARGCRFQVGTDMLFEQIPAYLEFFGFPTTTPEASALGGEAALLIAQQQACRLRLRRRRSTKRWRQLHKTAPSIRRSLRVRGQC